MGILHEDQYTCLITSRSLLVEWEMFRTNLEEKIQTNISSWVTILRTSCRLWDYMEKYCRARQDTDDNMAHAHCMPDTQGYRYTLRLCNTYCFSTATVVARTRLSARLYVQCLSCFNLTWPASVAYRGGDSTPSPIPKDLQNRAKLNPIVKTVKNCWF